MFSSLGFSTPSLIKVCFCIIVTSISSIFIIFDSFVLINKDAITFFEHERPTFHFFNDSIISNFFVVIKCFFFINLKSVLAQLKHFSIKINCIRAFFISSNLLIFNSFFNVDRCFFSICSIAA